MANFNYTDFYIRYKGHPTYVPKEIIEDEIVRIIVMKVETIFFTNKGDLFGDPEFGGDLEKLLFETRVSADFVKKQLVQQINTYVNEISDLSYTLDVTFQKDPENYQDMMFIDFKIKDVEINAYFA